MAFRQVQQGEVESFESQQQQSLCPLLGMGFSFTLR